MSKPLEETLKKLQEGAADNNATVMLEGERFRVRTEDGCSCLYELDKNGGSLKLVERTNAQGTPEMVKEGGESSSVDAAVKEMSDGVQRRRQEAEKAQQEAEQQAEKDRQASPSAVTRGPQPQGGPGAPPAGDALQPRSTGEGQVENQQRNKAHHQPHR